MIKKIQTLRKAKENMPKKRPMVVIHKRQIAVTCFILLVGVAGYLNWSFQTNTVDPEVASVYNEVTKKIGEAQMVNATVSEEDFSDYFSQAKMERDVRRSEAMDMLTTILESKEADSLGKKEAEEEIRALADYTEKEVMMENLIRGKGYENTVVFMGKNLISIAVKSSGLNEVDVAILQDIAMSATGYGADTIKIVEIK